MLVRQQKLSTFQINFGRLDLAMSANTVTKYIHQVPDTEDQWKCMCSKVSGQKMNFEFKSLFDEIKYHQLEYSKSIDQKSFLFLKWGSTGEQYLHLD